MTYPPLHWFAFGFWAGAVGTELVTKGAVGVMALIPGVFVAAAFLVYRWRA